MFMMSSVWPNFLPLHLLSYYFFQSGFFINMLDLNLALLKVCVISRSAWYFLSCGWIIFQL